MTESEQRYVSNLLRSAMREKYGRLVSAAKLSRDLHIWSEGRFYVSAESVRKWLIGQNQPRYQALVVLEAFFGYRFVEETCTDVNKQLVRPIHSLSKGGFESLKDTACE